jgi:hypothetical protein
MSDQQTDAALAQAEGMTMNTDAGARNAEADRYQHGTNELASGDFEMLEQ